MPSLFLVYVHTDVGRVRGGLASRCSGISQLVGECGPFVYTNCPRPNFTGSPPLSSLLLQLRNIISVVVIVSE